MSRRLHRILTIAALTSGALRAQTVLTLSSATVPPGGTASLELSLKSDGPPIAALEWTFRLEGIGAIAVDTGPALISAAKTVVCTGDTALYRCLGVGANAEMIPNGIVARISATLAPDSHSAVLQIVEALGSTPDAAPISIDTAIARITVDGLFGPRPPSTARRSGRK